MVALTHIGDFLFLCFKFLVAMKYAVLFSLWDVKLFYLFQMKTKFHEGLLNQRKKHCFMSVNYIDVIMGGIASQITSLTIVCSTVYSDADQRKHQSSSSLTLVRGIHRWPGNSLHKWPVTRKMFPFDDVIMGSFHSTLMMEVKTVTRLHRNHSIIICSSANV